MSSPFDRLMNTAKMRLPGAVDDAMRQELFEVFIDFFKDAAVWQERLDIEFAAGSRQAKVLPVAGRILKLMEVYENDRPVFGYTMPEEGVIHARFPFDRATVLTGVFMMTVTDPVTRDAFPVVPLDLVGRHHALLLDGLLAKMMSHPSKPYTNVQMAAYHQNRFRGSISRARNEQHTGNVAEGQNWRFPRNFK